MKRNLLFILIWLGLGLIAYLLFAQSDINSMESIGTPIILPIGLLSYLIWKLIDRFK